MYPDQASLKLSLSCGFLMRDTENHDLGQDFTIIQGIIMPAMTIMTGFTNDHDE